MNPVLPAVKEQRREVRRAAQGTVMVRLEAPQRFVVHGRLLDVSQHGFRMSHEFRNLQAGQVVDFSHNEAAGRAKVVWNRITATRVETGFLVLEA
jgi:hypothetical protein